MEQPLDVEASEDAPRLTEEVATDVEIPPIRGPEVGPECQMPEHVEDCSTLPQMTVTFKCLYYDLSHWGTYCANGGCEEGEPCWLCPDNGVCDTELWLCVEDSPGYHGIPNKWNVLSKCFGDPDGLCVMGNYCDGTKIGGGLVMPTYDQCTCCPGSPGYPAKPDPELPYKCSEPDCDACPGSPIFGDCAVIRDSYEGCLEYLQGLPDPTAPWHHCAEELCGN